MGKGLGGDDDDASYLFMCYKLSVVSDQHLMVSTGQSCDCKDCGGKYILIKDEEDPRLAMFDKPLPCFGCGIGWCSLLLGFICPLMWYYAAVLYLCKYYNKDPRERGGLAASAFVALICTIATCITLAVVFF